METPLWSAGTCPNQDKKASRPFSAQKAYSHEYLVADIAASMWNVFSTGLVLFIHPVARKQQVTMNVACLAILSIALIHALEIPQALGPLPSLLNPKP